ncbi:MAG: hypothetical protein PUJ80_11880 [Verrucomicrobiota bacterium]|nr:hypothetical protein [Verrucomicrobiota bacterium]MDY5596789.1 hypothetical protein [Kiritimatiellia bacterium]
MIENEEAEKVAETVDSDAGDAQINDTDIVFDCPHCGHNLCIDYRGAGLQINCSECGEAVLVPIPDGMKIDDLDLDPGEILKQLFATRRNLQRAEARAEALEARLSEVAGMIESVQDALRADA